MPDPSTQPIHRGPHALWLIRHGQSAGNMARDAAELAGEPLIDIGTRDIDTPLGTGRTSGTGLGAMAGGSARHRVADRRAVLALQPCGRQRPADARYLVERLNERDIMAIDAQGHVPNCGVNVYEPSGPVARLNEQNWQPRALNFVLPLHEGGQPVTPEPDVPVPDAARPPLPTPHAGEMASLTGYSKQEILMAPLQTAREAAAKWNALVALKGACTVVATPDGRCWRHEAMLPGLATSGSGDSLAGVVPGLASCGAASPKQAAVWGIALHARGARLARRIAPHGFLARELTDELPALMAAPWGLPP